MGPRDSKIIDEIESMCDDAVIERYRNALRRHIWLEVMQRGAYRPISFDLFVATRPDLDPQSPQAWVYDRACDHVWLVPIGCHCLIAGRLYQVRRLTLPPSGVINWERIALATCLTNFEFADRFIVSGEGFIAGSSMLLNERRVMLVGYGCGMTAQEKIIFADYRIQRIRE